MVCSTRCFRFSIGLRLKRSLLLLAIASSSASAGAATPKAAVIGTERWQIYGTEHARGLEDAIPGGGSVTAQPRVESGQPWSSGAGMPVPDALAAGDRVTATFWARASQETTLTISLQSGEPDYARFATADVTLMPEWRQVSVSGVAPADLSAGSQSLSVPLGATKAQVTLGPVAFFQGRLSQAEIARAFDAFRPAQLVTDVRIPSEPGVVLAGSLHLPTKRGASPFPLAVLIQGSGPNGRGGFPEIVKRLTADGIAALEYDKRGIGQSTGTYEEDVEKLTADAIAAIGAMRARDDIDGSRVALIGQSQGGVVAPAVAAADPTIAAVVTLGGSVGDGLPYLERALYSQMIVAGLPEAGVRPAVGAAIALLQARIDGKDAEVIAPLRTAVIDSFEAAGLSRPQAEGALAMLDTKQAWRADRLRSASDLKSLQIPVLAVFGAKDPLVVSSHEAPAARDALAANKHAEVVVLDGLSHWFQEGAVTGTQEESTGLGPNLGSPRLVTLVGTWLRAALVPSGAEHNEGRAGE